jgi:hypothetical protein
MALPFPHGTGSGQIANGAQYSVTDTPGSTGGRFVGFGEPGSSAIANRAAWALSMNIDYVYTTILSADKAVNRGVKFTSANQDTYQILDSVFCGNNTYPGAYPTNPEGMRALFGVHDALFNPLTDGAGNEVQVASVYDATRDHSVYMQGFVTNPVLYFCTVNPSTGVVVNPDYTIPVSTVVNIIYAAHSTLATLPIDAFTRYSSITGEEVPAGVILQDGTRPMNANLNLNTHSIISCQSIGLAPTGSPSSGIGVMNPINVTPASGTAPNIFMVYSVTGTELNAKEQYATLQMLSPAGHFASATISMNANLGSATPDADMMFTVVSAGATTRQVKLNSTYGSFGPTVASPFLQLGSPDYPWGESYLTRISGNAGAPVLFATSVAGHADWAPLVVVSDLDLSPPAGINPFLYMGYLATGTETDAILPYSTITLSDTTGDNTASITLWANERNPATNGMQMVFSVQSTQFGVSALIFDQNFFTPTFHPSTDFGCNLGDSGHNWASGFISNVYSSAVSVRNSLILNNSHVMQVNDGMGPPCYPVMLEKGMDFDCFIDFGAPYLGVTTGQVIDPSFSFYGTDGAGISTPDPTFGRSTLARLFVPSGVDETARIDGPKFNYLADNKFHCRISIAIEQLSGVMTTYRWSCGFRTGTFGDPICAYIHMEEYNTLTISFDDFNGSTGNVATEFGMPVGQFVDIDVMLTPGFLNVLINGNNASDPIVFNPADPATVLYATPIEIVNTGGTSVVVNHVDYVHVYSEGHMPRSISG